MKWNTRLKWQNTLYLFVMVNLPLQSQRYLPLQITTNVINPHKRHHHRITLDISGPAWQVCGVLTHIREETFWSYRLDNQCETIRYKSSTMDTAKQVTETKHHSGNSTHKHNMTLKVKGKDVDLYSAFHIQDTSNAHFVTETEQPVVFRSPHSVQIQPCVVTQLPATGSASQLV